MIPEKLKTLIQLLIDKTLAKKAIWEKGSGSSNQFKLSISKKIAITISEWENSYSNDIYYGVFIYNENGDSIERFDTETYSSTDEDEKLLQSFYKAASDQYYKVEETLDEILKSINSEDVIGKREESETEEDDLPF